MAFRHSLRVPTARLHLHRRRVYGSLVRGGGNSCYPVPYFERIIRAHWCDWRHRHFFRRVVIATRPSWRQQTQQMKLRTSCDAVAAATEWNLLRWFLAPKSRPMARSRRLLLLSRNGVTRASGPILWFVAIDYYLRDQGTCQTHATRYRIHS